MKILIFGTGVIGTIYGYVLARAGNDVTHYVRPGKAQSLENGIQIQLLDGRSKPPKQETVLYNANIVESFSPANDYNLVIVSVRHYQLDSVLPFLERDLGKADVLFFNSNWNGLQNIDAHLPQEKYLWGYPVAGGGYRGQCLNAALLDNVILGEIDGQKTPRLERIQQMFVGAGLTVEIQPNILHWLWVHFAFNCGLIAAAFKAGSPDGLLNSIPRLHDGILAGRETLAVCEARGVDVKSFEDAKAFYQPGWLGASAFWLLMKTNQPARKIVEMHTAIDELQVMYGDVLKAGVDLNVSMPHYLALKDYVDHPHIRS
jgi:2-dehydropantoate 2-reductase